MVHQITMPLRVLKFVYIGHSRKMARLYFKQVRAAGMIESIKLIKTRLCEILETNSYIKVHDRNLTYGCISSFYRSY